MDTLQIPPHHLTFTGIIRRGSRNFSRGGGGSSKKIWKFCRPFFFGFWSTKLIFWALPKHYKDTNSKKGHKGVFRHFDQKFAFFRRALPPQNYYRLAPKGPSAIFRVRQQIWISQNCTKGGTLWVGRGSNPWEKASTLTKWTIAPLKLNGSFKPVKPTNAKCSILISCKLIFSTKQTPAR